MSLEIREQVTAAVSRLPSAGAWSEIEEILLTPHDQPLYRDGVVWSLLGEWLATGLGDETVTEDQIEQCERIFELMPYQVRDRRGNYTPEYSPLWPYMRHLGYGPKRKIGKSLLDLIEKSTHIRSLEFKASDLGKKEDFIFGLSHLERLEITSTSRTKTLELEHTFEHIKALAIPHSGLHTYALEENFPNLTRLEISYAKHLTDLSEIANLDGLEHLSLRGCEAITSLEPLRALTGLETLDLYSCKGLTDHETLACFEELEWLDLTVCWRLGVKPDVSVLLTREAVKTYQETILG